MRKIPECKICGENKEKGTTFRSEDARLHFVCNDCTHRLIRELYTDTMDIRLRDFVLDDEGFKWGVKRLRFEFVEKLLRFNAYIRTKEFTAFDSNGKFFANAIPNGDFVVTIIEVLNSYPDEHKAITEIFRNNLTEEPKKSFNELMDIAREKYLEGNE